MCNTNNHIYKLKPSQLYLSTGGVPVPCSQLKRSSRRLLGSSETCPDAVVWMHQRCHGGALWSEIHEEFAYAVHLGGSPYLEHPFHVTQMILAGICCQGPTQRIMRTKNILLVLYTPHSRLHTGLHQPVLALGYPSKCHS